MSEQSDRAIQYGATGAAAGAVAGPVGAAIGGAAGLGYGWLTGGGGGGDSAGSRLQVAEDLYGRGGTRNFGGDYGDYGQMAQGYGARQAPQTRNSQYVGQQYRLGQQLMRESQGGGIGHRLIQQQAQGQADRGMRQQMGMAASARPGQGAMASRQAMMNAGNMNAQVGGQAASAQGQYQLGAQQQYGQFLAGARGQDDAQNQFNADARLRQLGLNDSAQLESLRQRLQLDQMNMQDRTTRYGIAAGQPTQGEQMAGALQGGAQAYAMYRQGQNGPAPAYDVNTQPGTTGSNGLITPDGW